MRTEMNKFKLLTYMTGSKLVLTVQEKDTHIIVDYSKKTYSQSIHKSDQQNPDVRLEVREQQESDSAACRSWNIHPGNMVISSAPVPTHLPWVTKN